MPPFDDNNTATKTDPTVLDFAPPRRRKPWRVEFEIALIVGSAVLIAALRSTIGRAVLALVAAGLTGCVIWGLSAR